MLGSELCILKPHERSRNEYLAARQPALPFWRGVQLTCNNRYLRSISEINNRIAFEQQGLSSFNSDHAQSCFCTDANCFETDYRHVEPHVLFWFGDFNHNCAFSRQCAAALEGLACSFESFNRTASSVLDTDRLPNVESRDFL